MMNNNNNGRPLTRKQTVRIMVALTILAWATQTLMHQWGFGADLPATRPAETAEKFVPESSVRLTGATLELRSEATVVGAEVKLRQICRWSDRDKAVFEPIADLVLVRLGAQTPIRGLSLQEVRGILRDAGVNTAPINFSGATSCTVSRSDVEYGERTALQQWIEAREPATTQPQANTHEAPPATAPTAGLEQSSVQTLRDALVADLATRLGVGAETLQVNFKPQDEKALNVSKPLFRFDIEPVRAKTLGNVMWNVTIAGAGEEKSPRKLTIQAEARAWEKQLVVLKPLATKQVIRAEDVVERRALVTQFEGDPLVTLEQTVGQQAGRELKPGMVLTGKMIDPVPLVKTGQFVTVMLQQGAVKVKSVARAMEGGTYGQTIRVKNEATKDVFEVIVTGPQSATMSLAAMDPH